MENRLKIISDIVIATSTSYNPNIESDVQRSEIAKKTIKEATNLGYGIIVADFGSSDEFLREIESNGAKIHSRSSMNMGKGKRDAILAAYKTEKAIIALTEPEKENYIQRIIETAIPIKESVVDMVIPKRRGLESYPTAQRYIEPFGNAFWKELTGTDLDVWFGPRTFKRELSDHFLNYKGEYGDKWDSIFIPVMNAIKNGNKVMGVTIDYTHPAQQTLTEEHNLEFYKKRMEQLDNLLTTLETHWKLF